VIDTTFVTVEGRGRSRTLDLQYDAETVLEKL
jgi:hypothetical protein